jgi:6-phosphogluconolactonase
VANAGGTVSGYIINSATGLTAIAGSPFAAGPGAESVVVDPSGKFAYVANAGSDTVSEYAINQATGTLTAIAGSPLAEGARPFCVAVDPSGKFVYVANSDTNTVSGYTINQATGALAAVAGSPFAAGATRY